MSGGPATDGQLAQVEQAGEDTLQYLRVLEASYRAQEPTIGARPCRQVRGSDGFNLIGDVPGLDAARLNK